MVARSIPTRSSLLDAERVREALAALRRRWREARRRDLDADALRALDATALHDLGLSRSEIESVAFEAGDAAAPTRRRIARPTGAPARDGPHAPGGGLPRRLWLHSAWPVGLLLAVAAAGWQPAVPGPDGPAPAAGVPDATVAYLPAQFAAQEAAAPIAPQPEPF